MLAHMCLPVTMCVPATMCVPVTVCVCVVEVDLVTFVVLIFFYFEIFLEKLLNHIFIFSPKTSNCLTTVDSICKFSSSLHSAWMEEQSG